MAVDRLGGAARGVLPLGLRQQAVGFAGLLRKPGHELLGVVPRHVDDGALAAAPIIVARLVRTAARSHACIPLRKGDLIFADRERLREGHLALRAFIRVAAALAWRRSHHELACGHYDLVGTVCAVAERIFCPGSLPGSPDLLPGRQYGQLAQDE